LNGLRKLGTWKSNLADVAAREQEILDAKASLLKLMQATNSNFGNGGGGSPTDDEKVIENMFYLNEALKKIEETKNRLSGSVMGEADTLLESIFGDVDAQLAAEGEMINSLERIKIASTEFVDDLNQMLEGMVVDTVSALAEMAGAWAAGADMDGQFDVILGKFGDFAKQMGRLIMGYGIALKAMKKWDKPGLMIAGGIALMVLGGAISHLANKGVEGSSGTGTSSATGTALPQSQMIQVQGTISNDAIRISAGRGTTASNSYNGLRYGG